MGTTPLEIWGQTPNSHYRIRSCMVQLRMRSFSPTAGWRLVLLLLGFYLLVPGDATAQAGRRVEAPGASEGRFFEQLRRLFLEADLRRAFEMAQPVQCSTLTSGDGEWRPVAFFNENRNVGDSHHRSIEDVKSDPSVYIFKGECRTDQSSVQLVTKFPVEDSLYAYIAGKTGLEKIKVNVNPPVSAFYDPVTQAYRFELPYMYAVRGRSDAGIVYSLVAAYSTDRYAPNVKNRWDCKSVNANDVTFQFLICQTQTLPRDLPPGTRATPTFGANAYFILSDGREASTSVKLSFGPGTDETPTPPTKAEQ